MKPLFLLTFIVFGLAAQASNKPSKTTAGPVANAGPDQTIYLTQTSSVTLDGSGSSSGTYQWTDVSTDYKSGATITSPQSAVTTVTGLKQGVWYFQLAVTSGGVTSSDLVVVTVDYDVAPTNGTQIENLPTSGIATNVNNRSDTINFIGYTFPNSYSTAYGHTIYMERSRLPGMTVDNQKAKFISTLEDGYQWNNSGYARSECTFGTGFPVDSNKTYVLEWKGYFPQSQFYLDQSGVNWASAVVMMQVHANNSAPPPFGLNIGYHGNLYVSETPTGASTPDSLTIGQYADFYNKTHTIRVTLKEGKGYPGQDAFIKIEIDGVQKYYRNTGGVGATWQQDYLKFASLYDYGKRIVDPGNYTRNRKFSLVTESYRVFELSGKVTNIPPTASAGSDQTITLPSSNVTLSGSGKDADGSISSYKWSQLSGPSTAGIANVNSASTGVSGLTAGVYQFQLTVTDNGGATGTSTVTVTVKASANKPPTANAGPNLTITLPTDSVTLAGSGNDSDGTITSYKWSKVSGPASGIIMNTASASTSITGLAAGVYQFQLTVTDNSGATGTSTVTVTVNAAANIPPTANAGSDQTITLPTSKVTLSGSGKDVDGSVTTYKWSQISGPSTASIASPASTSTVVSGLGAGAYQFQLTVTDNSGATGTSTVTVTVNAAANIPPVASAGPNQTITLPASKVTLSGTGTDADGSISAYKWSQISGPSTASLVTPDSTSSVASGLTTGVYQFQLTVTDNLGATGTSNITVTVKAAANIPPTANAGPDQIITLPANSITLNGSGNDSDGRIASYLWKKISGPSATISDSTLASTAVTGLAQGNYQFELTVTDNQGAVGKDIVNITVNPAANIPPTANAGADQIINLPNSSVTLNGSGNDSDGTISSYLWKKISGPSATISDSTLASATVTGLVQGNYQFELAVTDNRGAVGTDIVNVTVNPAANIPPIANAGADQAITLPINSISLNGSGNDSDGTISSYLWKKISGPSATISDSSLASTTVKGLVQGNYQFELTVTDNKGAVGTDIINIIVNPAANIPPTANAGADQTITLPTSTVTLAGSGSDADGSIASYVWKKISGPSATISFGTLATTSVNGLVQGNYQFELIVTDNMGAIGRDTVKVTVNPAPNIPPTANAGPDQTITLPTNSTILKGSGIDTDGSIASYAWSQISGPAVKLLHISSSAVTVRGLVQGSYQFELTVTDNMGAVGKDTVSVSVNVAVLAVNIPPTANAGTDQTITLPSDSVTLSGSGTDTDGSIASYLWTKISGPSVTISNSSLASVTLKGLVKGNYQFELTVTDNKGAIGTDIVNVTVNPAPNIAPTANAGPDQTITLPASSVTLAGSGSDVDGSIASYLWTQISGPSATLSNSTQASSTANGLLLGVYEFELTVTDNSGATAKDTMMVTVNPDPNKPPVANAGSDQTIILPVNSVTLHGSGIDSDGSIASYLWTKIAGPSSTISNSTLATTTVTGLVQGNYQFQLTVTDNQGASATSIVNVTVNPAVNIAPTANAGPDQTITLPTNNVALAGSGNDSDGSIASYLWKKISGPSATLANSTQASATVTGLVQGNYQFELTVTDNQGAVGKDIVNVTVNPAANIAPTANAGADQTITLPVSSITLKGSGSDVDGSIASYLWKKISGPSATITGSTLATTTVTGLVQGNYQFELTVTDDKGAVGKDVVNIAVNPAANIPPAANAGTDQTITLPASRVTLSGSGTDSDGTISGYLWKKISGPSATISTTTLASTTVTGLVQGNYQFELTVTDNKGAVGKDIVNVTVNPAANIPPSAQAGADQTITLPASSVTLAGSGSDSDGRIVSYVWTKISGPSASISNPDLASTSVTGLVQGSYQFGLTVTDDKGAVGTDVMNVTVKAAANIAPTANAGPDRTITLPTNSITLTGSGSDSDGTIASYLWTRISGPSATISTSTLASTTVKGLIQGKYQFELTVTDNKGAVGTDIVNVTVNPAVNIAPTANAGTDQTITLPSTLTLSGSGKDVDGVITGYNWTELSGPGNATIIRPADASSGVINLTQGIYEFELTVTDDKGAVAKDTVKVSVNAASTVGGTGNTTSNPPANIAPVAHAGRDTTVVSPVQFVTLKGSGTDSDGYIAGYSWNQIAGPSSGNILSVANPSTDVSNLIEGTYSFELTVTDNNGAQGNDTVNVTVALGRYAPASTKVVNIYPNPVHDIATVDINTGSPNTNIGIIVTDMSGRTVYAKQFVSALDKATEKLNLSNLIKGAYIVTVYFDGTKMQAIKVLRL